jgi:hypothetical protein
MIGAEESVWFLFLSVIDSSKGGLCVLEDLALSLFHDNVIDVTSL